MRTIFADAESFYSTEYSLRRITPPEYILGDQWETHGWAVIDEHLSSKPFWLEGDEFANYLQRLHADGEELRIVTHNALFDMCIIGWRYGIYPKLCVDTMSMARALLSHELPGGRVSLDNVAKHLGHGSKLGGLANVKDMRLADLKRNPELYEAHIRYAERDVELCRAIYYDLAPRFPATEFAINHMIIEMATRPQFTINADKLYLHKAGIEAAKQNLLDRVGIDKSELMSNDKFALALQRLGVEPPMKISPTTGQETWAFAKTDPGFIELEEHDDPDVQALHAARVGFKSTQEETRTQRFIDISRVTFDGNQSWMPIPLRFSGAHTHRFSGDWKINEQNLPAGRGGKTALLREAHEAPEGHEVLTCDASQIEARLTAWLCGQWDLVEAFERGDDVYSLLATEIFGTTVTKKDKARRQVGKRAELGLGFSAGAKVLFRALLGDAREMGLDLDITMGFAEKVVNVYRRKRNNIKNKWYWLNDMIPAMASGAAEGTQFGPCMFEKEAILLPSGLRLRYHELKYIGGEWTFTFAGKRKRIYGGKILENVVQALDRVCVMDAALRVRQRCKDYGIRLAHQVHDEIVYVPHSSVVADVRRIVAEEMARRPVWGPTLPLAAETGVGANYGEAK